MEVKFESHWFLNSSGGSKVRTGLGSSPVKSRTRSSAVEKRPGSPD